MQLGAVHDIVVSCVVLAWGGRGGGPMTIALRHQRGAPSDYSAQPTTGVLFEHAQRKRTRI